LVVVFMPLLVWVGVVMIMRVVFMSVRMFMFLRERLPRHSG
jgi:hypothetical protein